MTRYKFTPEDLAQMPNPFVFASESLASAADEIARLENQKFILMTDTMRQAKNNEDLICEIDALKLCIDELDKNSDAMVKETFSLEEENTLLREALERIAKDERYSGVDRCNG